MTKNRHARILSVALVGLAVAGAWGQDLDTLIKGAGDADAKVRQPAGEKLVEIGAPAVGPLVKLIATADTPIANAAKVTLCDLTVRAGKPEANRRAAVSKALADAYGASTDVEMRKFLARLLGYVGGDEAVDVLATALTDEAFREPARRALLANPSPAAGKVLRDWLTKADPAFRVGIIDALGARRDAAAVPALILCALSTVFLLRIREPRASLKAGFAGGGKVKK